MTDGNGAMRAEEWNVTKNHIIFQQPTAGGTASGRLITTMKHLITKDGSILLIFHGNYFFFIISVSFQIALKIKYRYKSFVSLSTNFEKKGILLNIRIEMQPATGFFKNLFRDYDVTWWSIRYSHNDNYIIYLYLSFIRIEIFPPISIFARSFRK